ncbi:MAG TPA: metallophosphoesterase [Candidatus Acidoferrum sp.]|nr:metallophosphoesterase [Candidatus Acidoferrum sp.]
MLRLTFRVFQNTRFLTAVLLLLASLLLPARATPPPNPNPVLVAIGDVHGDFDDFCSILQRVALIDEQRHWTGGKATFVQLGDLIDRGPKPREVLDLMMSLDEQAAKAGGQVVSLLGNHEVMNLMGDLRYVTPGNYASFVDSESEKRQGNAFQKYMAWRKDHSQLLAELNQPVLPETEAEWMTRHPQGFIEHREAFSPNGIYGRWLRQRSALVRIGSVIFLHGGINPDLTSVGLDQINERIRGEIHQYDEARQYLADENVLLPFFTLQEAIAVAQAELIAERKQRAASNETRQARIEKFLALGSWLCVREDGPVWFRGYDQWSEEDGAAKAAKILAAYNATNIVVGHTVQKTATIRSRFGGKIILIDTGMLSSYYHGGKPSALEIDDDKKFTAVYLDHQEALFEGKPTQSQPK